MAIVKLDTQYTPRPATTSLALDNKQALAELYRHGLTDKRWTFVLSDNLKMTEPDCLHLPKPGADIAQKWLEKIIAAGQCRLVITDSFPQQWLDHPTLEALCSQYQVTWVNIRRPHMDNTLVYGPW